MTPLKYRLILDLDETHGPIQCSIELHNLDSSKIHRITTWTPAPFDDAHDAIERMLREIDERYGRQLTLDF